MADQKPNPQKPATPPGTRPPTPPPAAGSTNPKSSAGGPVPLTRAGSGKPAPAPKKNLSHVDNPTRQLGQKLVDLGYLDEPQLDELYEEMRASEAKFTDLLAD